jgi:hypothetical protein
MMMDAPRFSTLTTKVGEPVRLDECPPGLFLFGDTLGFRSEYWTPKQTPPNQPDAYVVESGEYFWGGADTTAERSKLLVRPLLFLP